MMYRFKVFILKIIQHGDMFILKNLRLQTSHLYHLAEIFKRISQWDGYRVFLFLSPTELQNITNL